MSQSALQSHVKDIARGINDNHPDKQEYVKLAEEFRMPYWDWASKKTEIVPQIALNRVYREKGPTSSKSVTEEGIEDFNPLFAFKFPPGTSKYITVNIIIFVYAVAILVDTSSLSSRGICLLHMVM